MEWLHFYWPDPNGELKKVKLDGSEIFDDPTGPPMVEIFSFNGDPTISDMSVDAIEFIFENDAIPPPGYWVEATFVDIGCYISDGI